MFANSPELMDVARLVEEIDARLRALPDRRTASVRAVRREFSRRLANTSSQVVIELALRLLERPDFEYRLVAYELVCHHRAAIRSVGEEELKQFGRGMDSWEDVDTFSCYLAGPAWRERQVPDALIHRWAHSRDRWWRRAALVSTVALNNKVRGGTGVGDVARTLEVCRIVVRDRDDMVVKAMSWALRELARRDPQAVHAFMAEQQDVLAARVVREVHNKLATGLKNPRR